MEAEELRQELEKLLTCPVCLKRLNVPVTCCTNGHPLCSDCSRKVNSCPQCRNRFAPGRQTLLNNILEIFRFNCKYIDNGCKKTGRPEELSKHEDNCNFRSIKCVFSKNGTLCQKEIPLPEYVQHVETFHDSYVHQLFTPNSKYKFVLPNYSNLENGVVHYRVLKDENEKIFVEMISYDNNLKMYQISVHFIGNAEKALDYFYTINVKRILTNGYSRYVRFSNYCIPNLTTPQNVKKLYAPLFLLHQKDLVENYELVYSLKIQNAKKKAGHFLF